jgi:AraC family transcriptional regulator
MRLEANEYAAGTRHLPHAHAELQISLVLWGDVEERVGNRVERGGSLSVVVKDPGVRHADDFGSRGACMARLALPRTGFAQLVESADRALEWQWSHEPRVAKPFLRLVERAAAGANDFWVDDEDMIDLFAAISARPAPVAGGPPSWLANVVADLRDGWTPGMTVADLASQARVHPVYLARCIRRWYGVAAGDLLRAARLRHAADALVGGGATVSAVAHATGFADEAHLNRTLRTAIGATPARFSRTARAFRSR